MKKYRTKIATPFMPKGEEFESNEFGIILLVLSRNNLVEYPVNPIEYPELFEEVEERTDVKKLAEWIFDFVCCRSFRVKSDYEVLAQAIIDAGVDVSKLIGGME